MSIMTSNSTTSYNYTVTMLLSEKGKFRTRNSGNSVFHVDILQPFTELGFGEKKMI